jgi:hypothetical protein
MRTALALIALFFVATAHAEQPHVIAQLPAQELKLGDIVEIPINILSEDMEIVSYAVELRYDKAMLRLLDVYPGLSPHYSDKPMFKEGVTRSNGIWITGSAKSFGENHKIINVANLKFELIAESRHPRMELLQTGPLVRYQGFTEVDGKFTVEGEVDLYNFMFDHGFE